MGNKQARIKRVTDNIQKALDEGTLDELEIAKKIVEVESWWQVRKVVRINIFDDLPRLNRLCTPLCSPDSKYSVHTNLFERLKIPTYLGDMGVDFEGDAEILKRYRLLNEDSILSLQRSADRVDYRKYESYVKLYLRYTSGREAKPPKDADMLDMIAVGVQGRHVCEQFLALYIEIQDYHCNISMYQALARKVIP